MVKQLLNYWLTICSCHNQFHLMAEDIIQHADHGGQTNSGSNQNDGPLIVFFQHESSTWHADLKMITIDNIFKEDFYQRNLSDDLYLTSNAEPLVEVVGRSSIRRPIGWFFSLNGYPEKILTLKTIIPFLNPIESKKFEALFTWLVRNTVVSDDIMVITFNFALWNPEREILSWPEIRKFRSIWFLKVKRSHVLGLDNLVGHHKRSESGPSTWKKALEISTWRCFNIIKIKTPFLRLFSFFMFSSIPIKRSAKNPYASFQPSMTSSLAASPRTSFMAARRHSPTIA